MESPHNKPPHALSWKSPVVYIMGFLPALLLLSCFQKSQQTQGPETSETLVLPSLSSFWLPQATSSDMLYLCRNLITGFKCYHHNDMSSAGFAFSKIQNVANITGLQVEEVIKRSVRGDSKLCFGQVIDSPEAAEMLDNIKAILRRELIQHRLSGRAEDTESQNMKRLAEELKVVL